MVSACADFFYKKCRQAHRNFSFLIPNSKKREVSMDKATLDKINALTRRNFNASELYTFPVVLCHNDVDRDFERFSDAALEEMAPLFVGKTIISDHNPTADNMVARLYDTEVVSDPRTNVLGEPYRYLKGYAYMVRTESNKDIITEIDAGIKKEVSISCSASRRICSICGKEWYHDGGCDHVKGQTYDGQVCYMTLDGITDAYELSFVAVPAQVGAGVTKKYTKEDEQMETFTPITTKKDFDAAVQQTVDAAVAAKAAEFEGWTSPEDAAALHQQVTDLTNENQSMKLTAMRQKAAQDAGLAPELADRLVGETAEELAKDAQALAAVTGKNFATPHFTPESTGATANKTDAALLEVLA
jgi:hypothetical protein